MLSCLWSKVWDPFPILPDCIITHCVAPPELPPQYNLVEDTTAWTPVGETKDYTCDGTSYWESDRSKTTFHILCLEDGSYKFDGNWPNCTEGTSYLSLYLNIVTV